MKLVDDDQYLSSRSKSSIEGDLTDLIMQWTDV